jgi:hypothetical protein
MSRIPVFCIFILSLTTACLAQFNQTESISITTYYPAPYGVYKNIRIIPSNESDPSNVRINQPGTMYFNDSDRKLYVHNGSAWGKIFGGSNFYYGYISPLTCGGNISNETFNNGQLCSSPWYANITFPTAFTKPVHVMVTLLTTPDNTFSPCAHNVTDVFVGYPSNITANGFQLWASGSPITGKSDSRQTCSSSSNPTKYDDWYTVATASWFAISE